MKKKNVVYCLLVFGKTTIVFYVFKKRNFTKDYNEQTMNRVKCVCLCVCVSVCLVEDWAGEGGDIEKKRPN